VTNIQGRRTKDEGQKGKPWRLVLCPLALVLSAGGCTSDQLNPFHKDDPPKPATQESVVLRPDGLARATMSTADSEPDLLAAKEVFRAGEYAKAEALFHQIAEGSKGASSWWSLDLTSKKDKDDRNITVAEEARFMEAECLRMQGHYPKAADTYIRMLNDFGSGLHREQAVAQLFEIANYWLVDTRREMEESKEKAAGKRWYVAPHFINFERSKPFLDEEGRAIEALEHVRYNDIDGPFADRALFMIGTVKFFNEDYREADYQFTQIVERHKTSPLYARAAEMAVISKNLSTGGSDYDARKCAEAREMVPIALAGYQKMEQQDPQLSKEREEFLRRQLAGITMQQAEKDYKTAEFYLRTKRPESAFFLFEIVRRRYAGTKYADLATEQMHNIRAKVEKENGTKLSIPEAAPLQPDAAQFYQQVPGAPPPQPSAPEPNAFGQPRPLPPSIQR
jgi:outer membrane protein assembly factor BamD (BamD/ComL family)